MTRSRQSYDFIAIGGSSGALKAMSSLLTELHKAFSTPIGLVLHRLAEGGDGLKHLLQSRSTLLVTEPWDKMPINASSLYLAPANYHLMVENNESFSLSYDEAVGYSRPSIDVFFETAADVFGPRLIGIILSGANQDGAQGMQYIHRLGGKVIVQSPIDSQMSVMPKAVLASTTPHFIGTASEIANHLNHLDYGK